MTVLHVREQWWESHFFCWVSCKSIFPWPCFWAVACQGLKDVWGDRAGCYQASCHSGLWADTCHLAQLCPAAVQQLPFLRCKSHYTLPCCLPHCFGDLLHSPETLSLHLLLLFLPCVSPCLHLSRNLPRKPWAQTGRSRARRTFTV